MKPVHSCEEVLTPTWSNKDVIDRVLLYDGVICKERRLGMQPCLVYQCTVIRPEITVRISERK